MENVAALFHLLDLLVDDKVFEADAAGLLVHLVVLLQVYSKHYVVGFVETDEVTLLDHLVVIHFVHSSEQEVAVAGQVLLQEDSEDPKSHGFVDIIRKHDPILLV